LAIFGCLWTFLAIFVILALPRFAFWSKQPGEFGYFWPFFDVFGQHPLVSQKKLFILKNFCLLRRTTLIKNVFYSVSASAQPLES